MRLIDANLLIYALDKMSPHNPRAKTWLEQVYDDDDLVGLPRLVILAFIRITTNPRIMQIPLSGSNAITKIDGLLEHPKTVILECGPNHWNIFKQIVLETGTLGPSITDAFLASLAIEHGATLCSHDEGFRRFKSLRFENPLSPI